MYFYSLYGWEENMVLIHKKNLLKNDLKKCAKKHRYLLMVHLSRMTYSKLKII